MRIGSAQPQLLHQPGSCLQGGLSKPWFLMRLDGFLSRRRRASACLLLRRKASQSYQAAPGKEGRRKPSTTCYPSPLQPIDVLRPFSIFSSRSSSTHSQLKSQKTFSGLEWDRCLQTPELPGMCKCDTLGRSCLSNLIAFLFSRRTLEGRGISCVDLCCYSNSFCCRSCILAVEEM